MTANPSRPGRSARRNPTLRDVIARRLAEIGLGWATRWVMAGLALVFALALFAAWGLVLVAIAWIAGALGLTSKAGDATGFLVPALIISTVIMFFPTRWAARNILRAERTLDGAVDRLAIPTTVDPGTVVERRVTTRAELAALDARLAAPVGSAGREPLPEEPEG